MSNIVSIAAHISVLRLHTKMRPEMEKSTGEIVERLQARVAGQSGAASRDISVTLQPADIVAKIRKNLKSSVKNYKEYLVG